MFHSVFHAVSRNIQTTTNTTKELWCSSLSRAHHRHGIFLLCFPFPTHSRRRRRRRRRRHKFLRKCSFCSRRRVIAGARYYNSSSWWGKVLFSFHIFSFYFHQIQKSSSSRRLWPRDINRFVCVCRRRRLTRFSFRPFHSVSAGRFFFVFLSFVLHLLLLRVYNLCHWLLLISFSFSTCCITKDKFFFV